MKKISINSPVILGFVAISLAELGLNSLMGGRLLVLLALRKTQFADPMMYVRLVSYVFVHVDFSHFINNALLLLAIGPMLEEKHGASKLVVMLLATAVATGIIHIAFFGNIMLVGASGLVFMLILLSSFTNLKDGTIPLTFIIVALLYIGNEVIQGVWATDSISQLSHIAGGVCGSLFGLDKRR